MTYEYKGKMINELVETVENILDGEGLPYYDVPEGAVTVSGEAEDEIEMARR
jgi:hypothetical protein